MRHVTPASDAAITPCVRHRERGPRVPTRRPLGGACARGAPRSPLGRDHGEQRAGRAAHADEPGRPGGAGDGPAERPVASDHETRRRHVAGIRLHAGLHRPRQRPGRRRPQGRPAPHCRPPLVLDEPHTRLLTARLRPGAALRPRRCGPGGARAQGNRPLPGLDGAGTVRETPEHPRRSGRLQRPPPLDPHLLRLHQDRPNRVERRFT